ncbi:glutathione S-transferase family protein [Magnetovibrio sp.]|uniref:glutathione S-transferase family protein n=1 Tax=Magnetovibrio sp. TaxID=2024836 RepID=UPI002F94B367
MYELYYYPGNASITPHVLLEEIGAPFQLHLVERARNEQKSVAYKKLNPRGLIPVLVDGDTVLYETAAICLYLSDKHPDAALAPPCGTAERGHFYKWLMFLANTVHPDTLIYFYPERYTLEATGDVGVGAIKDAVEERLTEMFQFIDAQLVKGGPYLMGEQVSLADHYLLMLARWGRNMKTPPRDMRHLRRNVELMLARPAVQRALATEGLSAPIF